MPRRDAGPDTRDACDPHHDSLIAGIGDGSVVAQVATGGMAKGWVAARPLFAWHSRAARERQTRSAFPVRETPGRRLPTGISGWDSPGREKLLEILVGETRGR